MAKKRSRHKTKQQQSSQNIKQIFYPKEFRIQKKPTTSEGEIEAILTWINKKDKEDQQPDSSWSVNLLMEVLNLLTETATEVWRARRKLIAPGTVDQPINEMKPIYRPLDSAYQSLHQAGLKVYDLTNQPYVPGMIEKVLAFEPTQGFTRDVIKETIKPTIYFQDQLMQVGEVIVGTVQRQESSL